VFFTEDDLPRLRENYEAEENAYVKGLLENYVSQSVTVGSAYSEKVMFAIDSMAYYYALFGDETVGKKAVELSLSTAGWTFPTTFNSRRMGRAIFSMTLVYDWCYDLIGDEDKETMINTCIAWAGKTEVGWPPQNLGAVTGHGAEQDFLRYVGVCNRNLQRTPRYLELCRRQILR
jgi:heparin/heparan-sulfate lyase